MSVLSDPFSRRKALGVLAGVGLVTAGCKVQTTSDAGGPAPAGADKAEIKLPKPVSKLPTESVNYRGMMSGGIKAPYFDAVWKAFHGAHDNIALQLDTLPWDKINEAIPLGVRNKTAPDLFQMPNNVPVGVAVSEGWVAALDDIIPDFESWKKAYPTTAFIPGVHVFDGKTYSWTFTSNKSQYGGLMFFDSTLMSAAGYDPVKERFTTDTLREAAKKITKNGNGKAYGLLIAGPALGGVAMNLASLAGMPGNEMDPKTGQYNYTNPLLREAIDQLLAIKSDGSFFPGMLSLPSQDAADQRMVQGVAGITFDGAWNVPNWKDLAPEYQYGVAKPPTPADKSENKVGYVEGTAAPLFAYKESKYPTITGELLRYMGSVDGQIQLGLMTGGLFSSEIEEVNDKVQNSSLLSGHAKEAADIMTELRVTLPLPQVGNPDVSQVILQQKAVTPTFADVVQGIMTGQIKDIDAALRDLQSRSDKSLDDAIAAARKKGAKVSREDWAFSNWEQGKDYTPEDYDQR
ncbi:MAG TPA: ABC transporter substrate-binding protein [Microlunatus sp.]